MCCFGVTGFAWLLLPALGIPPSLWSQVLLPTAGNLPVNEDQYVNMVNYLRRQGHLFEGKNMMGKGGGQQAHFGQAAPNPQQQI